MYFPKTRRVRPVDTVQFFPTVIPFPKVSLEDQLRNAGTDIVQILTNKQENNDLPKISGAIHDALLQLGHIFKTAKQLPELLPPQSEKCDVLPRVP